MHKFWYKRICTYISLHPSIWLVVGRCFDHGEISIHCWWDQCKNVSLWNLHFSTAKFGPCQKGELPEHTRFPGYMEKYLLYWPGAIALLGTLKESDFWGPISELSGNYGLGHEGSDGSGGNSILQEPKRSDSMVCCFAQEDAVSHLLAILAIFLILPEPEFFLSSPSMGSEGTAIWSDVHSSILTNCGCHLLSPHSSLKQGMDTWSLGQSWKAGRPLVKSPICRWGNWRAMY